ncbi:MAG: adenylate kinase [Candidatus Omnitrophota bacterium]
MRLVLLGPPGAGKGTLAALIKKEFGVNHLSTGDLLRAEMKNETPIGQEMKQYVESGELVPDEVVTRMIAEKLKTIKLEDGVLFDGYPRTGKQAADLDRILNDLNAPLDSAVFMEIGLPVIIQRLTGRRICRQCGAVYHVENMPPEKEGVCDVCGGELYQRPDDNEETIRKRMDVYMSSTEPVIAFYEEQGKLIRVNAEQDAGAVAADLQEKLKADA